MNTSLPVCRSGSNADEQWIKKGMNSPMTMVQRIMIAALVLLVDLVIFFFPLTAVFLAYIIICNPLWFREFLNHMNQPTSG